VKKKILIIVFVLLLAGVGALVYFGQWQSRRGEMYYSGTIEATQANLAFQVSGRVFNVAVREGYVVTKNQLLAELDPALYTGRSAAQVGEFVGEYLHPLLARARPLAAEAGSAEVRV